MRHPRRLFLSGLFTVLILFGCERGTPSAPTDTGDTPAFLNEAPGDPTACYTTGMLGREIAEAYAEALESLAECDQESTNDPVSCEVEQQAHAASWTELMAAHDGVVAACSDEGGSVDQDGDGVEDAFDSCPTGETGWTSDPTTDNDGDGCRDAGEDSDDDNDGVEDAVDACPLEFGTTADGCPLSGIAINELLVTEVFPDPLGTDSEMGEYVEIANPTSNSLSLDGITLEVDNVAVASLSGFLQPGAFCVISNVTSGTAGPANYTSCIVATGVVLPNSGATVRLTSGSTLGDEVTYLTVPTDESYARDAEGEAFCFQTPTPNQSNFNCP